MLTERFAAALALAVKAHDGQLRKGTQIPYVSHPLAVASMALELGADEDQAIAALLHDVLEDGGAQYASSIQAAFGPRVLAIVQACTDGTPDDAGAKPPWAQRKLDYIEHLATAPDEVLLVSGADKLHNARAIVADLQEIGPDVFTRFTAGREGTLWYYQSLLQVFAQRQSKVAPLLATAVAQMLEWVGPAPAGSEAEPVRP